VSIGGVDYTVASGVVDLHDGDLMSWSMAIDPDGGGPTSVVFLSDFFRRLRRDSLEFPGGQPTGAEFFGGVGGTTLTIRTIPLTGTSTNFANQVGGAHTWTFAKR
jgi:hypothetical protein